MAAETSEIGPLHDGQELSEQEAFALAMHVAVMALHDPGVIEWEELPNLTEASFDAVLSAVGAVADNLSKLADHRDQTLNIDGRHLYERATAWPPPADESGSNEQVDQ